MEEGRFLLKEEGKGEQTTSMMESLGAGRLREFVSHTVFSLASHARSMAEQRGGDGGLEERRFTTDLSGSGNTGFLGKQNGNMQQWCLVISLK